MSWYERYMNHPDDCKCRGCERIGAYNDAISIKPSLPCPSCASLRAEVEKLRELVEEAATTMESTGEPYNFWSKRAKELRRRAKEGG